MTDGKGAREDDIREIGKKSKKNVEGQYSTQTLTF